MTDEHGGDEKIIAVPTDALHPFYNNVRSYEDLPQILRDQIAHFFQHYKDLEPGKWVKLMRWDGPSAAEQLISMQRAWRRRRNRLTATAMLAANGLLILTSFGLYYAGSEVLRPWMSNIHTTVGLCLLILFPVHVLVGRRSS
jgi:hypothetical protein